MPGTSAGALTEQNCYQTILVTFLPGGGGLVSFKAQEIKMALPGCLPSQLFEVVLDTLKGHFGAFKAIL